MIKSIIQFLTPIQTREGRYDIMHGKITIKAAKKIF